MEYNTEILKTTYQLDSPTWGVKGSKPTTPPPYGEQSKPGGSTSPNYCLEH